MADGTNTERIYDDLQILVAKQDHSDFLAGLMAAYGFSHASIARTINGTADVSQIPGCIIRKRDFVFQEVRQENDMEKAFSNAIDAAVHKERFVIATDYHRFLARDMKTKMGIDIDLSALPMHCEFFLPWMGIEKVDVAVENVADRKVAEKMASLYDELMKDNPEMASQDGRHAMNVFLTRLLFCFFADDTGIFQKNQFINAVIQNTSEDGHDMANWLSGLFDVLDIPKDKRRAVLHCYQDFPYVDGDLFIDAYGIPNFTFKSRNKLLEVAEADWSAINPDVLGSMFQTVIAPEQRAELGQHYTSVPNIMKVLNPLFLDDLRAELAAAKGSDKKLNAFIDHLRHIKVFDPACGSGNFLIIAYKEMCKLEIEAINSLEAREFNFLDVSLEQFYGIEIDDFATSIARLSLWLAKQQVAMECTEAGVHVSPSLPLPKSGHIVEGNACRLDWDEVCPCERGYEVYVCGNPPYSGHTNKSQNQREDIRTLFEKNTDVDYVSCWFLKASRFIAGKNAKFAFVSTNSITQGKHLAIVWPSVLSGGLEIFFAHRSFKWANNALHKAGVTVVVIGVRNISEKPKYIFEGNTRITVGKINPRLNDGPSAIVLPCRKPLSRQVPTAIFGTMFVDGGNLIMSDNEYRQFLLKYPQAKQFLARCYGSKEFIDGSFRWCLWIDDDKLAEAEEIPEIRQRIDAVREMRLASRDAGARKLAQRPWQMREHPDIYTSKIIIPSVSSERRPYIPMGYLPPRTVVSNLAFCIYDAPMWLFAILESTMHMAWVRVVGGRMKTDYRYSNTLCYNTFPFPDLSEEDKTRLIRSTKAILAARANHPDKSLAWMYNPETMPDDLKAAHDLNDRLVDTLYRKQGFESDEERLAELFKRYGKLISEENQDA